jgi:hypothetical protein
VTLTFFKWPTPTKDLTTALSNSPYENQNPLEVLELRKQELAHEAAKSNPKPDNYKPKTIILGLVIPPGYVCTSKPFIFLDCKKPNPTGKPDTSHWYCDMYGVNRGRCQHVSSENKVIDDLLVLQEWDGLSMADKFPKAPAGKRWQIDYRGKQKRLCSLNHTCGRWKAYKPDEFNCTIISSDAYCYNESNDFKRNCTLESDDRWKCKNWYYGKGEKTALAFEIWLDRPEQKIPNY